MTSRGEPHARFEMAGEKRPPRFTGHWGNPGLLVYQLYLV